MGMFDNIRCKFPLPVPAFQEHQFQTKDTPNQYLDLYEIREDGTLWVEEYDTEDRSEAKRWLLANPGKTNDDLPKELGGLRAFFGCMTRVNQRWRQLADYHGDIEFYSTLGEQHTGWIEFKARFTDGKLSRLERVEYRPVEPEKERKRLETLKASLPELFKP